jgi:phosphotransferase system IIB component
MTSANFPTPFNAGDRLIDPTILNSLLCNPLFSNQDGITANAGGGQTNAYQITATISRIGIVATNADSVKLPASKNGAMYILVNNSSNAMQVFGHDTATINNAAFSTGISQAANTTTLYICPVKGTWYTVAGGSGSGTPGGTTGQIQYNNSGVFGGLTIGTGLENNAGTLQVVDSTIVIGQIDQGSPVNSQIIVLDSYAAYNYTITGLQGAITTSGSISVTIYINGVAVTGLNAVSVTTSQTNFTATANNVVAPGNEVTLEFSSNSSAVGFSASLQGII